MNIEVGQFYRTRDGNKVAVVAIGNPLNPNDEFCVVGFMRSRDPLLWTRKGRYMDNRDDPKFEDIRDLIATWIDPPTPLEVCKMVLEYADLEGNIAWGKLFSAAKEAIAAHDTK